MTSFIRFHLFQMKYMLGIQDLRYRIRTTPGLIPKLLALFAPLLLLAAIVVTPYIFILYLCYEMVSMVGSAEHYLTLILFLAQILILFFALLSSFTAMFGRKDHEFLSALPIPKRHIYMSTVLHVYASGVLSAAFVLIPSVIIYGLGQGFSLQMILMSIPAVFLVPVLPVCLAYAFVLMCMRLIAYCPFREQLATVFGVVFLVGYMIFNYSFSAKFSVWFASFDFVGLFERSGWFSTLIKLLPGVYLTRMTMIGNLWHALAAFGAIVLISGALLTGMYWIGSKSFFAVRASLTMHANRKKTQARYKSGKPFWAYMKKEFRGLIRCPVYVMNGLIGILMGPVMLICITADAGLESTRLMGEMLYGETGNAKWLILPALIVMGVVYFVVSTISVVPGSSYSREGLSRWVTQVAPVSRQTDFMGRAIASLILFWIGDLLTFGTGWFIFRFAFSDGIVFLLSLLISAIPCVFVSLYIDFRKPKLVWEKEAEAMKRNTNTFISMLLSWFVAILSILPMGLYMFDCLNKTLCLTLTLAVPVLLAVAGVSIVLNKLNRRIVV